MWKPGKIIHAEPDGALYVGDNKYLVGEKTVEIPSEYIIAKQYLPGICICLTSAPSFIDAQVHEADLAIGFAIGLFLLDIEPRRKAIAWLENQQAYGFLLQYNFLDQLLMNTYELDPEFDNTIFRVFKEALLL